MAEVGGRSQVAKSLTWDFATGTRRVCGVVRRLMGDLRVGNPADDGMVGRCDGLWRANHAHLSFLPSVRSPERHLA